MNLISLTALIAFTLLQCYYVSASQLECYKCIYHEGLVSTPETEKSMEPSDPKCKWQGTPEKTSLAACDGKPEMTCALIHLKGEDSQGHPFEVAYRNCLPVQEKLKHGCSDHITATEFKQLRGVDREVQRMIPDSKKAGTACTCKSNGCNKDLKTSSAAVIPTVGKLGFILLVIISSFWI